MATRAASASRIKRLDGVLQVALGPLSIEFLVARRELDLAVPHGVPAFIDAANACQNWLPLNGTASSAQYHHPPPIE